MSSFQTLGELYRKALDLNLRYYGSLGKLTAEYLRDLSSTLASVQTAASESRKTTTASGARTAETPRGSAPAVMVFEGEAGSTAIGVFLVGNSLAHEVSAPVTASPVLDEAGRAVSLAFSFDPAVVTLRPGEQLLVRAMAVIDPALEAGVRYRGELLIPELQGTRIPFIVRRRAASDEGVS